MPEEIQVPREQLSELFRIMRVARKFPDTKPTNLLGRARALDRRRAKNKVARASRKANR
jgi:hypothetical protein